MMANNTTSTSCLDETAERIKDNLSLAAYELFLPFYFLIGVFGHGICLYAFCKQYFKKETAFAYQILVSFGDLVECIVMSFGHLIAGNFSGLRLPGFTWFQENYAMMWFAAHIAVFLEQAVVTISLLLYVMMAADRAFAVAYPLRHKALNHERLQILAAIISLTVGLSTSIFDGFRYEVRPKGRKYEMYVDEAFLNSTIGFVCDIIRNVLRLVCNIMLIIFNIAMVVGYHFILRQTKCDANYKQMSNKRRATQKTLLLLTFFQSFFQTLDMTLFNIYFFLDYSSPGFADCSELIMGPICDLVQEVAGTMELFALLIICKRFRLTIFSALPRNLTRILRLSKPDHDRNECSRL